MHGFLFEGRELHTHSHTHTHTQTHEQPSAVSGDGNIGRDILLSSVSAMGPLRITSRLGCSSETFCRGQVNNCIGLSIRVCAQSSEWSGCVPL